ncbi:MAG: bifunctional isocitrate dehydrogenase kinase/phosphatase [Candidatus Dormibacteraeota bacterium]|uniref:Bifunctional isocitrate dehydrogenase kinase/phosphatase n=1 Tax=Candidatus Dormiibacter inghamiae TaxID=3127013 RepID=A0A934KAH4_9BACT|nr:bifunctional isocitrate dehydrogenase kinase/phosphatase [Candidatus Dormibacteraeota bacterium]MBJ7607481.1 bifunctional isocitrate dehydrogenase kinase/phosphatase [Candidatus Dormibacteraeota bacterium]
MAEPTISLSASRLANIVANAVFSAFVIYAGAFEQITRRAQERFVERDWPGAATDASERLDLYTGAVDGAQRQVENMLAERSAERLVWAGMKAVYSGLIAGRQDWELAETFFNSVTRRVFATEGVDANIEFVDSDFAVPDEARGAALWRTYEGDECAAILRSLLTDLWFNCALADPERDVRRGGALLLEQVRSAGFGDLVRRAEVIRAPFFRRKGAYLIGRLTVGDRCLPFGLAFLNSAVGVTLDAVLTGEDDISIVFSFTRSHFFIDLGPPHQLVTLLKELMPKKPVAELYIALGHHKHGKTELYRDLLRHLATSDRRFERAPGTPGTVMLVFAMDGYDVVFKVIRDRFPVVKPVTPQQIRDKYRLVFHHDRAGRLVEAQEFEHLQFDSARFAPELLQEFRRDAERTVELEADRVVVHHAYLERRVTPLDWYLRQADPAAAAAAISDFGQAIKDLAASGIFPGELLPKNFGLTRHSRVVCYDYDELGLLSEFTFRPLPAAVDDQDELADEAWFGIGPRDLFPEEFGRFLGLTPEQRKALEVLHRNLYDVTFWQSTQALVRSAEIIDIFPYPASRRLPAG